MTLTSALNTPAFWVFGLATALYGLVASGLGLFNEAVLAERGFSQEIYHQFLAASALIALVSAVVSVSALGNDACRSTETGSRSTVI